MPFVDNHVEVDYQEHGKRAVARGGSLVMG